MCVIFEQQNFFIFVLVYSEYYTIFVGELVKGTNHLYTLIGCYFIAKEKMNNAIKRISETSALKPLMVTEMQTARTKVKAKTKSAFECTFSFARMVKQSSDHFKTKECKAQLELIGITWTMKQFFDNLGEGEEGFGKEWCYRLIKAVKLEFKTIVVDNKEVKVNMLEKYLTTQSTFSIAEFIKFASDIQEEKEKEEFKLKLVFNDIKLSINSKDELTTDLTKAEIKSIMVLLQRKMDTMTEK